MFLAESWSTQPRERHRGPEAPLRRPSLSEGAGFQGPLQSGKVSREQGSLECRQPLLLSWPHLDGACVCVKTQADFLTALLGGGRRDGLSNLYAGIHLVSNLLSNFWKDEAGFSKLVLGSLALCLKVQDWLPGDIYAWSELSCGLRTLYLNALGGNGTSIIIRSICKAL